MSDKPLEILMVEDNLADVHLMRVAFRESKVHSKLNVVRDGVEAMEFLRRVGRFSGAGRPDLILLDLNLPRKDGRQVLAEIKADPDLKRIPVVILTTSQAEGDIISCYDLNANSYTVKPADLDKYVEMIRGTERYWLTIVTRSAQ